MPSPTEDHLVVELNGGYNVGIAREGADVDVLETDICGIEDAQSGGDGTSEIEFDDDLLTTPLISTGGTIASTVDYRMGVVIAQFDAKDVFRTVPDLAGRANYRGRVVANILSENTTTDVWVDLVGAVAEEIEGGADGVAVMHGTDMMQFSTSVISFMLDTPVPVIFVDSQHSTDRPFSDNVMGAVHAVKVAKAEATEVMVYMHVPEPDDVCVLCEGTRVRRNHASQRDTFKTVDAESLGEIDYEAEEIMLRRDYTPRCGADLVLHIDAEPEVELVEFTLEADPAALDYLDEKAGVVIEGTGLGHIHIDLTPQFEEPVEGGTVVTMTSQCFEGRVCDRVYDIGRDLLDAGTAKTGDTLPGTTKVKLMWTLANVADPTDATGRNLEGELTQRSIPWE